MSVSEHRLNGLTRHGHLGPPFLGWGNSGNGLRPEVHRTACSGWALPHRAAQAGHQLAGQFPPGTPACRARVPCPRQGWPFWLSRRRWWPLPRPELRDAARAV